MENNEVKVTEEVIAEMVDKSRTSSYKAIGYTVVGAVGAVGLYVGIKKLGCVIKNNIENRKKTTVDDDETVDNE